RAGWPAVHVVAEAAACGHTGFQFRFARPFAAGVSGRRGGPLVPALPYPQPAIRRPGGHQRRIIRRGRQPAGRDHRRHRSRHRSRLAVQWNPAAVQGLAAGPDGCDCRRALPAVPYRARVAKWLAFRYVGACEVQRGGAFCAVHVLVLLLLEHSWISVPDVTNHSRKMEFSVETWEFKYTFVITGHTVMDVDLLYLTISEKGSTGRGEAAGAYFLGETRPSMMADVAAVQDAVEAGANRQQLRELLPPGGARNAIDCALWDLEVKQKNSSIWELTEIKPGPTRTVLTIGIGTPE